MNVLKQEYLWSWCFDNPVIDFCILVGISNDSAWTSTNRQPLLRRDLVLPSDISWANSKLNADELL